MSAIAHVLVSRGEIVSGSDRQESDATRRLRAAGVNISIGHSADNVDGADIVVYTAAVNMENPEMAEAARKGITMLERPVMLGKLMEPYKHRIAVSGTHGKTTTTSMIDLILDRANLNATSLIGGDIKSLGGNARIGNSPIILTEACEAFASFLHLYPSIAVITNIDADHLDFYGTIECVEESFKQFVSQVDTEGCVIAWSDDERVRKVLDGCGRRVVWFGLNDNADVSAINIDTTKPQAAYTLVRNGEALGQVVLGVPGEQNIMNSLGAAAAAFEMGVDFEAIKDALKDFTGAGRRFEILYDDNSIMVVDDYAHHPTEVKATLSGTKTGYDKHVIAIFQPHLFSRTQIFMNDFADALSVADEVIICPIYAARELPIEGVSAEGIVTRMKENGYNNVRYAPDKDALANELKDYVKDGDMVLILGAGDVRAVGEKLAQMLSGGAA